MPQHGSAFPTSSQTFWELLAASAHTVWGHNDFSDCSCKAGREPTSANHPRSGWGAPSRSGWGAPSHSDWGSGDSLGAGPSECLEKSAQQEGSETGAVLAASAVLLPRGWWGKGVRGGPQALAPARVAPCASAAVSFTRELSWEPCLCCIQALPGAPLCWAWGRRDPAPPVQEPVPWGAGAGS